MIKKRKNSPYSTEIIATKENGVTKIRLNAQNKPLKGFRTPKKLTKAQQKKTIQLTVEQLNYLDIKEEMQAIYQEMLAYRKHLDMSQQIILSVAMCSNVIPEALGNILINKEKIVEYEERVNKAMMPIIK